VTLVLAGVVCALALFAQGAEAGPNANNRSGSLAFVNGTDDITLMHTDGSHRESFLSRTDPNWSPDGQLLAYRDGMDVRVIGADGSNDRVVTPGSDPSWTPDSQLLVSYLGDILRVPLAGSPNVNLTNTAGVEETEPAASPDGSYIAYTSNQDTSADPLTPTPGLYNNLWIMEANGDNPHLLYEANPDEYGGHPSWAPDSHRLAFINDLDVWTVPPNGNNPTNVTNDDPAQSFPAWSWDGELIAYAQSAPGTIADGSTASEIWTIDPDSITRRNLTNDAGAHDTMPDWQPWLVQTGRLAFVDEDSQRSIAFADADGKHFHNSFGGSNDDIQDMDYAPNGTLISVVRNASLEFYDSLGESAGFLLGYPADPASAAWFPDSQHMVEGTLPGELYDVSPIGGGIDLTNTMNVYEFAPAVSPDGLRIAFLTDQAVGSDPPTAGPSLGLWTMDFDGLDRQFVTTVQVTPGLFTFFHGNQIVWSPNGTKLAYISSSDVWTVEPNGDNATNLTDDALIQSDVSWSPDGQLIAFDQIASSAFDSTIWTIDPVNHHRTRFSPTDDSIILPVWQPIWGVNSDKYYVIGDNLCSGKAGLPDLLATLKALANIPSKHQPGCPWLGEHALTSLGNEAIWGDTDCSDSLGPDDVIDGLQYALEMGPYTPETQPAGFTGCPPIGSYLQWIPTN
jgi:Tol biopolymer transport system component